METAQANIYISATLDCPNCGEYLEVWDSLTNSGQLGQDLNNDVEIQHTCESCLKDFIIDKTIY